MRTVHLVITGSGGRLVWALNDAGKIQTGLMPAPATFLDAARDALQAAGALLGDGDGDGVEIATPDSAVAHRVPALTGAYPADVNVRAVSSDTEPIVLARDAARAAGRISPEVRVVAAAAAADPPQQSTGRGASWAWLADDGSYGSGFQTDPVIGLLSASATAVRQAIEAFPPGEALVVLTLANKLLDLDQSAHWEREGKRRNNHALPRNPHVVALTELLRQRPEIRLRRPVQVSEKKLQYGAERVTAAVRHAHEVAPGEQQTTL